MTLSEEQRVEFDTPELQAFAECYLDFQHSSPCFDTQKTYGYFKPPKQSSEHDILYGCNRKQAYDTLMDKFTDCIFKSSFNKFFRKEWYFWESKTIDGLVIFRKWLL